MEDADYQRLLEVFYPFYFLSTMSGQLMTLYLILMHTPKNMRVLKYILTNTTVSHICAITICCFCQFRMITTQIPVQLRCYGLARYLEAYISFSLHEFLQFFVFASETSVVVTFYFKYVTMTGLKMRNIEFLKSFVAFHIPVLVSISVMTYTVIHDVLPSEVRQKYADLNLDVSEYSSIGILTLTTVPSRINFILMCTAGLFYPLICVCFRIKTLDIIDTKLLQLSVIRKKQHKQFITGLTIQAFLPMVCYTPVFGLYIFCLTTGTEILFQQYFMFISPVFPALLDPLVTCSFVTPYRRKLMTWCGIKKPNNVSSISVVMM